MEATGPIETTEATAVTEVVSSVSFSIPELSQRLERVDESQRDIICMYIVGYGVEEIAREHGVRHEYVEDVIRSFLNDLR